MSYMLLVVTWGLMVVSCWLQGDYLAALLADKNKQQ